LSFAGGVPLDLKASAWQKYKVDATQNTWVVDLSKADPVANAALVGDSAFKGLRVGLGGKRGVRAKYPNGDPELSGQWFLSSDPGMG